MKSIISFFQVFFLLSCGYISADETKNNLLLSSWIDSANDPQTDFPIQNLPYGVFKHKSNPGQPRIGVAIGDHVLDLKGCLEQGLFSDMNADTQSSLQKNTLNDLMSLNINQQLLLRDKITSLLNSNNGTIRDNTNLKNSILLPIDDIELVMPIQIGDYTDFYASIHHASHVGSIMRPDNPLMPNYKHMPIGYHGRSSSVVVSGTPIAWPCGQILNSEGKPLWSPCQSLDYELEMGAIIGKGNPQGSPIALEDAKTHIFGFVLLNDWSARDIQKWEYQPLGPFNGKNFGTTISPWVVTSEALMPYRIPLEQRTENDPPLFDYLTSDNDMTYNIVVEAYLSSEKMRKADMKPLLICTGNLKDLYWSFNQMVCHHTCSGCNLRSGDLLGSGTISGTTIDSLGCLLERIAFKLEPLILPDGTSRRYLESGDAIILRAYAQKENLPKIGFGECCGIVINANK